MTNLSKELQIFKNVDFGEIKTTELNHKVWFGAIDIATILGYSNPRDAIIRHCKSPGVVIHDVGVTTGEKPDGTPIIQDVSMKFINEGNVIRLITKSKMPKADEFESWIFDELVPTVLKTGGYIIEKEGDTDEDILSRALMIAQNKINDREQRITMLEEQKQLAETTIKEQAPKVRYVDHVLQSVNTYTTTQIAKELDFTSAEKLHQDLKTRKIMFKQSGQWMLAAKYVGREFTKTRTTSYTRSDGTTASNSITVWTESGRKFLHELYRLLITL